MMTRNRKVWGVLGLLLALVVVVGYGQQPLGQPQTLIAMLTVTDSRVRPQGASGDLELFIKNMDMHPSRNISYQSKEKTNIDPFPYPDIYPTDATGVAFFFADTGTVGYQSNISVLVKPGALEGGKKYIFCAWFRHVGGWPTPPPPMPSRPKITSKFYCGWPGCVERIGTPAEIPWQDRKLQWQCSRDEGIVYPSTQAAEASFGWDFRLDPGSVPDSYVQSAEFVAVTVVKLP